MQLKAFFKSCGGLRKLLMKLETRFSLSVMRRWLANNQPAFGGLDNCGEGRSHSSYI